MVKLYLSNKNLTKIPVIPKHITELVIENNKISKIENLPSGLQQLVIENNKISKIENLPDGLQNLSLSDSEISKIENLPNGLQELCLDNNKITKIENLPDRLLKLYLYTNKITKIENLPDGLLKLCLSENQITKIENLPDGLLKLYLAENQITKIENLPNGLQELDLSNAKIKTIDNLLGVMRQLHPYNNQITKIENLPDGLQKLLLHDNEIPKIENLPSGLQQLSLMSNKISELPLSLLELRYIRNFYHHSNPIGNIHPLVERWLQRLNREVNDNNKVYSDKQNIHNSSIQKSFRNSLGNLLKDTDVLTLNECKKHILERNKLNEQVKRELLNYCDDDTEHSVYLVKFDEVFQYVISRIIKHSDTNEMFKILNEEIKDTICKCFTGRMTRLVNVLNGFYDDINIQIGSNEQISNIILMLKEKYEGDELVKQVRLEMEEREYDNETIDEWLGFL